MKLFFFDITHIFGSVEPQSKSDFLYLYIIKFQTYWSLDNPPSSTRGEDGHMRSWTFLYEIQFSTTFIRSFFYIMRIFGSVKLQSTFPLQYIVIFKIWTLYQPSDVTTRIHVGEQRHTTFHYDTGSRFIWSKCGTVSKQERIFAQNFRKIVGWIKVIVKVGEKILLKPWE